MILQETRMFQPVRGGDPRALERQLIRVDGPQPLSIVRRRLPASERPAGGEHAPVLLVHGFAQNHYAWHLSTRSLANYLVSEGFDVFNLDLRGQGRSRALGSRPSQHVDDYVHEDLPAALDAVIQLSGRPRAFIAGHSMGGLIAYAAASTLAPSLAGIATLGSPYHFSAGSRTLASLSRLIGALDARGWLGSNERVMPIGHLGPLLHLQRAFWDAARVPMPLRAWAPGAFEPPMLREYLHRTFDGASVGTLVHMARISTTGVFHSFDRSRDYSASFEACDVPLLALAGTFDQLAPPPSVRPAYDRIASRDRTYLELPFGHADMLLGRNAPAGSWPVLSQWLTERAQRTR